MPTVVLKLGSSIVCDERGEPRMEVLSHVCEETASLRAQGTDVVLVSSGAIAFGMRIKGIGMRPAGMDELQAASAIGQGKLYRVYDELLASHGVGSAQVLLTFYDVSARMHYLNVRQTMRKLLDWHVVPVINENDTTASDEITFGDNDFLAAQVAILVGAERLVLLTDIDGLYTADPRTDPDAQLIPEVREFDALEGLAIGVGGSPLGSGGMRSKVVAAEMATAAGIPAMIVNGVRPGVVPAALAGGGEGTYFHPQAERVSSFKLWLRYAKPTRGRVEVDDGAARALREQGTSLLPVGVKEVQGSFEAGDAVEVTLGGRAIGKGIVNLSSAELERVKGMKSAQVREMIPRANEEAVHRDYFVLA
ncbi:MAG: glutamate 5-kinase [Thermoleophilaceae bacterium]|nr:glutamate 5-kinase [Thermoleophilaceae bacterium]